MPTLLLNDRLVDAKAILFDKDGTLVEFHELWVGTTATRIEELSNRLEMHQMPPLTQDERGDLAALLGVPHGHLGVGEGRVDPFGPLIMSGPADHETLAAGFIYQRRGGGFNGALSSTRDAFQAALARQRPRLLDGAAQVLAELRGGGWLLGIVTNDGEEQTKNVLAQMEMKDVFHSVVCAHEQTIGGVTKRIRKPDAEMVARFCREVQVEPSETILVADSHNDLMMGQSQAVHCAANIGVRSGVDTDELLNKASPDAILNSVADLPGTILTIRLADLAAEIDKMNAFYTSPKIGYNGKAEPDNEVLVAEIGKKVIGCVRLCREQGHRILRGMHVHPEYQHRGIGKRMLSAIVPMIAGCPCWCLPCASGLPPRVSCRWAASSSRPARRTPNDVSRAREGFDHDGS